MIVSEEFVARVDLMCVNQDARQTRDQDAFDAGTQAADQVRATSLEEALEQGTQLLLQYLSRRGMPISAEPLPETWPIVVDFCDGYSQQLLSRWSRLARRVLAEAEKAAQ